jgi:hypothetical protein
MIILPSASLRDFPTKTAEQVRPVLHALTSPSLLVVSGAGLAVPIIPPMSTLAWQLALNYLELGSFPARAASRSELRDRLLPAPKELFTGNRADSLGSAPIKLEGWRGQLVLTASDEALSALFGSHSTEVCGVPAICCKRCTTRDLPIPASPMISATWPSPSSSRSHRFIGERSSSSRPDKRRLINDN